MRIEVRYLAQLRAAAGQAMEVIAVDPPCTAGELVTRLAEKHGSPLRSLLLDEKGNVQQPLLLFVGDEQVDSPARPLRDGDVVTILSPMAGGEA
jgi:molybdopterin converting factor small subunit